MELDKNCSVHPIELCVYSMLSSDLDGLYQTINELRNSQVLLILFIKKCRDSLKRENDVLYSAKDLEESIIKLKNLTKRIESLRGKYNKLKEKTDTLTKTIAS
ncbi:hypothetical protein TPHA_0F01550 [Tetrapisispora phaffii CBS 4417]|uniref:Biogenesis of lysosome-related organelles complex 1 subunit SNN1 n=1 Tax=Tetrapisispora phaffii (strain ATCC 24235 / CBS 4417 / NBRC 1672 / NRRL Y-8282 / UCD 70-5) TaxID=1071381 RepID=G8BV57_TETPH|nr:hypothetical protein TPHA_0F01550 [Tetrapisispora phaffii CBS 4417]CCE63639.1 hypothetical protein TPHA_0F01550 [Tetrapisispora phaffii CBS 4417]